MLQNVMDVRRGRMKVLVLLFCLLAVNSEIRVETSKVWEEAKRSPEAREELGKTMFKHQAIVQMTFDSGISSFIKFEGRFPRSLSELCEKGSPYMPVSCEDIPNLLTGKTLLETERGTIGYFGYEPPKDLRDKTTPAIMIFFLPDFRREDLPLREVRMPGPIIGEAFFPYNRKEIGDANITAGSVSFAIGTSYTFFWEIYKRSPTTFAELEETFPILRKLKNAFRGDYAKPAMPIRVLSGTVEEVERTYEMESEHLTGPPGDYTMFVASNFWWAWIMVFGHDGRSIGKIMAEAREKQYRRLPGGKLEPIPP